ncbi:MAG: hypothetical protein ACJA2M_002377 [Polaribacter sp.]|jgi:hypothetical protein
MIAQFILLGLMTLSLGMNISQHGEERKASNGYHSLIVYIIFIALLYWGGFFDVF